jgi:hypothetical protein
MEMIGQQSPCIATGLCCLQNIPKPIKKITPVLIVIENPSSGDPSNDYVMQCPWYLCVLFLAYLLCTEGNTYESNQC